MGVYGSMLREGSRKIQELKISKDAVSMLLKAFGYPTYVRVKDKQVIVK